MVGRVPRRIGDAEPGRDVAGQRARPGALEDADAGLRHRHDLAPQAVEVVAVEPPRAGHEALGVDQVAGAALVDPDLRVGPAPHERARGPGVVEVDVGEQDRARHLAVERLQQRAVAGLRPGVDEDVADLVAADHVGTAQVVDVDLAVLRHPGGVPYDPGTP